MKTIRTLEERTAAAKKKLAALEAQAARRRAHSTGGTSRKIAKTISALRGLEKGLGGDLAESCGEMATQLEIHLAQGLTMRLEPAMHE